MNAGSNYAKAKAQAQESADLSSSTRYLYRAMGRWWISDTRVADSEKIDPSKKTKARLEKEVKAMVKGGVG